MGGGEKKQETLGGKKNNKEKKICEKVRLSSELRVCSITIAESTLTTKSINTKHNQATT